MDDLPPEIVAMLAQAEAAVAGLSADYATTAREDCAALKAALAAKEAEQAFDLAHNLKGQGGSFGYPLITDFAHQVCEAIRDVPAERLNYQRLLVLTEAISGAIELGTEQQTGPKADALRALVQNARAA